MPKGNKRAKKTARALAARHGAGSQQPAAVLPAPPAADVDMEGSVAVPETPAGAAGGAPDQPGPIPGVSPTRLLPPLRCRGPGGEGSHAARCVRSPGGPRVGPNMREALAHLLLCDRGSTLGGPRPVQPAVTDSLVLPPAPTRAPVVRAPEPLHCRRSPVRPDAPRPGAPQVEGARRPSTQPKGVARSLRRAQPPCNTERSSSPLQLSEARLGCKFGSAARRTGQPGAGGLGSEQAQAAYVQPILS